MSDSQILATPVNQANSIFLTQALSRFLTLSLNNPQEILRIMVAWEGALLLQEHMHTARLFQNLHVMRAWLMEKIPSEGMLLEFGVWKGRSINAFAKKLDKLGQRRRIFGFDSFKGFSEEWTGSTIDVRHCDVHGEIPDVPSNVELVHGYVEDTLPIFLKRKDIGGEKIAFMHIDTDTYTPAKQALTFACSRFQPGTVILFDQIYGYPGWKHHEYKALLDAARECGFEYEFLSFCVRAAAIRITRIGG